MNWIQVFSTNDILEISYLKNYLETNEIPFSLQDEGFLSLSYEAIPIHQAVAKFFILEEDFLEVDEFIKNHII